MPCFHDASLHTCISESNNIINTNPDSGGSPFSCSVVFWGCCELSKPAYFVRLFLPPFYLGDKPAHACVSLPFIISICSHLKRLANPRSHASNAPRIICVCFLTQKGRLC